jgi:hypothetical protein
VGDDNVANDRLINSTQGDSMISVLQTIAQKSNHPYNPNNKLDPAYIDYDSTHAAVTSAQVTKLNATIPLVITGDGYIGIDYGDD